jgi:hypothetical protein
MLDVLGVHGIGQQQAGRNQMLPSWQQALLDGIERALGRDGPQPSLDIAYYGDVFLTVTGSKGSSQEIESLKVLDVDSLAFLEQLEGEIVDPEYVVDVGREMKGGPKVSAPVARLGNWLDRKFGVAGRLLFFGDLVQVRRFQRDKELGDVVLERVDEGLAQTPRVLIGHSLGSIVAYEALCRIPNHGVRTLITLGSPLGLSSIRVGLSLPARECIPHAPPGVERWVNVYDPRDAVALAGGLAPYWSAVEDAVVDNESDPHAVTRYLGKKVTGAAVADGVQ